MRPLGDERQQRPLHLGGDGQLRVDRQPFALQVRNRRASQPEPRPQRCQDQERRDHQDLADPGPFLEIRTQHPVDEQLDELRRYDDGAENGRSQTDDSQSRWRENFLEAVAAVLDSLSRGSD